MGAPDLKADIKAYFGEDYTRFFQRYFPDIPSGRDSQKVVCPFHDDTDPSLELKLRGPTPGIWHCHGCDAGGDVFTFYALMNQLDVKRDFPRVLDGIADECGITPVSSPDDSGRTKKARKEAK